MSSLNEQQTERGSREPQVNNQRLQERVEMGRQASLVLENVAYMKAWESMRASITKAWKETATTDTQRMQLLHAQLRMLDGLQNVMAQLINGGKDAAGVLEARLGKIADMERPEGALRRNIRAVMSR